MDQIFVKAYEFYQDTSQLKEYQPPSWNIEEVKEEFLGDLIQAVKLNEVPPDFIFNWDWTAISLVPSSQWTLDKKGNKRVAIAGHIYA